MATLVLFLSTKMQTKAIHFTWRTKKYSCSFGITWQLIPYCLPHTVLSSWPPTTPRSIWSRSWSDVNIISGSVSLEVQIWAAHADSLKHHWRLLYGASHILHITVKIKGHKYAEMVRIRLFQMMIKAFSSPPAAPWVTLSRGELTQKHLGWFYRKIYQLQLAVFKRTDFSSTEDHRLCGPRV